MIGVGCGLIGVSQYFRGRQLKPAAIDG